MGGGKNINKTKKVDAIKKKVIQKTKKKTTGKGKRIKF
jgi:hypothetical protein